ncbi:DNA/RNA non-specific endonuclease [Pseudoalteromonas sp. A3]|uniref:DNA/RNA non-specific endonuclease n=1 Tax=Pseudoalteromonas sp. A3 TaxID=142792 RepID=UPI00221F53F9|nr:DNA/RNA non-specific endonuclease [Pseudoalteromonas sp. A3]MCW1717469.1 DNA/RNA non-specific endonuclease [Pseudoalteromonas sp. A3]
MQRYRQFMGNNHTTLALPCLKTKHTVANSISNDWHALKPSDYTDAYATINTDRGHQVPLASFSNTADWKLTNLLSNITPQSSALNQGPWVRLESAVRNHVGNGNDLYVVTGPLYEYYFAELPQANEAHTIPSGYFKIVMQQTGSTIKASAFIMEQTASRSDNFCNTEVSIDEVESRSGINVMPNLSYNSAQTIESSVYGLRSELGCN